MVKPHLHKEQGWQGTPSFKQGWERNNGCSGARDGRGYL